MNLSELPHLKSITDDNAPQLGVVLPKSNLYHYTPSVLAVKNIISKLPDAFDEKTYAEIIEDARDEAGKLSDG